MPGLREIRERLLMAYLNEEIDDVEFCLLYDENQSPNPDFPYWNCERFNLENLTDSECWYEFRFYKNDIFHLKSALQIRDVVRTYNRMAVDGTEALCIFLKRMAYPCRLLDLIQMFGRSVPENCIIANTVMNHVYSTFSHLLDRFNLPFMQPRDLEMYCQALHAKGAPLDNCFGLVDGTVRPISRPSKNQRCVYNGHKKVHALKFQSVVIPNGLVAHMYGPVEGQRHDVRMLRMSNLLPKMRQFAVDTRGRRLCIYGDPAYQINIHLQAPFRNVPLTPAQQSFNTAMSQQRVAVEWMFKEIINDFKFLDFKKKLKIYWSAVGKMYLTVTLLTNARCCLYGNQTSDYFECQPPTLEEYFV